MTIQVYIIATRVFVQSSESYPRTSMSKKMWQVGSTSSVARRSLHHSLVSSFLTVYEYKIHYTNTLE